MKQFSIVIPALFILFFGACGERKVTELNKNENNYVDSGSAVIVFDTLINDIGRIKEGEQVIAWFEYENRGDTPLIIENIDAGCGCTIPKWKESPLSPGKKETIKIIFDSSGKRGFQNIKIIVYSNAQNSKQELRLKSIVESIN